MSELQQRFEQAQKDVVSLAERPQNAVLLKLYSRRLLEQDRKHYRLPKLPSFDAWPTG